ncbi:MAG: uracil-DNA glycosylase [Alphaproteobacteria bacterium]|nr:uracil-DNA glycosylase [Alphaproteobacteria bacterium]
MKAPDQPKHDCPLCPRLADFRAANRDRYPDWFNGPVPSFGPLDARLLIAGLAPGLQGANRTGRPFTGDWAGDLLYATLLKHGLARGTYDERADDGLELMGCRIANAVRCVPPQNKPLPVEIKTCRPFLMSELSTLPNVKAILALGKIAHDSVCDTLKIRKATHPFRHGATYENVGEGRMFTLVSSYHCSRYNTNTGVLTTPMFEAVVAQAKAAAGIT